MKMEIGKDWKIKEIAKLKKIKKQLTDKFTINYYDRVIRDIKSTI